MPFIARKYYKKACYKELKKSLSEYLIGGQSVFLISYVNLDPTVKGIVNVFRRRTTCLFDLSSLQEKPSSR